MYWREVVASLYAWDLLDEGLEHILDTLEREALVKSSAAIRNSQGGAHCPSRARTSSKGRLTRCKRPAATLP